MPSTTIAIKIDEGAAQTEGQVTVASPGGKKTKKTGATTPGSDIADANTQWGHRIAVNPDYYEGAGAP